MDNNEYEKDSCKKCKHYNNGDGDIHCEFCDWIYKDRFEKEESK